MHRNANAHVQLLFSDFSIANSDVFVSSRYFMTCLPQQFLVSQSRRSKVKSMFMGLSDSKQKRGWSVLYLGMSFTEGHMWTRVIRAVEHVLFLVLYVSSHVTQSHGCQSMRDRFNGAECKHTITRHDSKRWDRTRRRNTYSTLEICC